MRNRKAHAHASRVVALLRVVLALAFVSAGTLHLLRTDAYARIVPPQLPSPHALVLISGGAEIVGGIGLLIPRVRRLAGWSLIALLIAVFPANVYMATAPERFADLRVPTWALWARLPLQLVLIAAVWWSAVRAARGRAGDAAS